MPVTIWDVAEARGLPDSEQANGEDFARLGLPLFGGCEVCGATIAAYNAYPSRSGYLRCSLCLGDGGFETAEEFEEFGV